MIKTFTLQFLTKHLFSSVLLVIAFGVTGAVGQIVVNETADELNGDGDCSLREAIQSANSDSGVSGCTAGSGADIITLPAGTYTLSVAGTLEEANATGDLDITSDVTINGAGSGTTIIQAGTTTANGIDRVFDVFGPLTLNDVTVRHGRLDFADGFGFTFGAGLNILDATVTLNNSVVTLNNVLDTGSCSQSCGAGGIGNTNGTLFLNGSTVSNNTALEFGGGICTGDFNLGSGTGSVTMTNSVLSNNSARLGGGMEVQTLNLGSPVITLIESTVSNNVATVLQGGGIYSQASTVIIHRSALINNTAIVGVGDGGALANFVGTATIVNSTVSGNSSADEGGGIYGENFTIRNSTFTDNSAGVAGGAITFLGLSASDVQNSIITSNTAPADGDCQLDSPTAPTGGNNLVDDFAAGGCSGVSTAAVSGFVGSLALNGGTTLNHAILPGSNAIDTGSGSCPDQNGTPLGVDQRNYVRAGGAGKGGAICDIGSFEFNSAPLPVELTAFTATVSGSEVILHWQTASETNNALFEVESRKSVLGSNWQGLGSVEGTGTTDTPQQYAFRVLDVAPGAWDFRLKQVDFDGAFEYSPVVSIEIEVPTELTLSTNYPNPFNPSTRIEFTVPAEGRARLTVYNALGRQVGVLFDAKASPGQSYAVNFHATGLATGEYLYVLQHNGSSLSRSMTMLR